MNLHVLWKLALLAALPWAPLATALAATDHARTFRDAYYLETHEQDLPGAIAAYEQLIAAQDAPADLVAEARTRLAACREDLRAADLARLMPPTAIVYAEIQRPGAHFEHLVNMLGLTGPAAQHAGGYAVPGEPNLIIPRQIVISPALLAEAKAFNGAAWAMTDFDERTGRPEFVLVLHPGDVDWARGLIETMAQFVRPADPIREYPTIALRTPELPLTVSFTHRLIVAGTQRALVEGALARLQNADAESLAGSAEFAEQTERRESAVLFAYVNAQEGVRRLQRMVGRHPEVGQQLAIAQGLFDLAHLKALSLAVGATPDDLRAEFVMTMHEGQTNLVYNLLRTPPMQGRALAMTPQGAAALVAIGINPAATTDQDRAVQSKAQTVQAVTGLDLGRELFGNIREAVAFVLAPQANAPGQRQDLPDAALVLAVGDPDKSEALWTYLLSLPGRLQGRTDLAPQTTTVDGVDVQTYPIDPPVSVHFARVGGNIVIGTSSRALSATIAAVRENSNVHGDAALQPALDRITPDTSVAVIGHVGRLVALGGSYASEQEAAITQLVGQAAPSALVTLLAEESPTRLRLAGTVAGLPQIPDVLEVLSQAGMLAEYGPPPTPLVPPAEPAEPAEPLAPVAASAR